MLALQRFVQSAACELNGVIRLTCPKPIVLRISKSDLLMRLHARHPDLHVEFAMSDHYLDLARGEADVALRSGDTVDNQLVGRKIADSLWAVYGGQAYLAAHGRPQRAAAFWARCTSPRRIWGWRHCPPRWVMPRPTWCRCWGRWLS